jgi:hypothetical protein
MSTKKKPSPDSIVREIKRKTRSYDPFVGNGLKDLNCP